MRVWLIAVGEPLPIDPGNDRQLRTGLVARRLADRGHTVVWWSSTFDHNVRRQRHHTDTRIELEPNLIVYLLHAIAYPANVSLRRILNHYQLAYRFAKLAPREPRPDVILCSIPTLELARAAVRIAHRRNIRMIVDIRDLWPDVIVQAFPSPLRRIARLLLAPMFRSARYVVQHADALVAVSPSYLEWGLERAGRPRTDHDRVYPLGYPDPEVDPNMVAQAERELLDRGVDPSKAIVWFVGTFGRWYDLSTVIEAARLLAGVGHEEVQFVLSGSGDNYAKWRQEASGLRNVVFTGWVNQPQIAYLMSASQIGLAAYAGGALQSYPNKLFEYMRAGLPVVSSLDGDTAELLARHRCGLTYRAGDSRDLVKLLRRLLDDADLRAEMAENAHSAFAKHYSAATIYDEMASFIEDFAAVSGAGGHAPASRVV